MQPHRFIARLALLTALGIVPTLVHAGLDAQGEHEVAALLTFVGQSHCTFIRNGKTYNAVEAKNHLELKLNYLQERNKVNSTEEFIDRAATQSSFSGRPYLVNCDGTERSSADWLKEELRLLRRMQP